MKTATRIIDIGRGPQIEGHRLTVMDVFYYLHRGYEFDFIQRALPSLTFEEFEAVLAYANAHRDELAEKDRRADERIREGIQEQKAKGLSHEIDESVSVEVRAARLMEKYLNKLAAEVEKNRGSASG